MTIQDLGSVGELIAAVATVATLIYLAAQIRQNTATMKTSAINSLHDLQLLTRDNDHYNSLVLKALRKEELTAEERLHMVERFFTIMRAFEGIWLQQQYGSVTRAQFDQHLDMLRWALSHDAARRMWVPIASTFDSGFRQIVEAEALSPDAPPSLMVKAFQATDPNWTESSPSGSGG
jgi:hypothetical protein